MDYLSSSRLSEENDLSKEEGSEGDDSPYTTLPAGVSQPIIRGTRIDTSVNESEEILQYNEAPGENKPTRSLSPFNCVKCQKLFEKREEFDRHLKLHEEYWCNFCNSRYKNKLALNRHLLCHIRKNKEVFMEHKIFKCHTCDIEFKSEIKYSLHLASHNNGMYTCATCYKGFKDKRSLTEHLLTYFDNKKYECPICKKRFKRVGEVKNHTVIHYKVKPYSCNQCDKSYKLKAELTKHMDKKHETKIICKQCDAVFKTRRDLRTHTKSHTFSCHICDKAFKRPSILKRHSIVHSEKRLYRCTFCNRTYKTGSTLSQHLLSHSDARNFKCPVCDKTFKTRTTCNVHMLLHLDKSLIPDKNKCSQCSKVLFSQHDLSKHRKSHENNKYFFCEICERTFRRLNTWVNHLKENHGFITPED